MANQSLDLFGGNIRIELDADPMAPPVFVAVISESSDFAIRLEITLMRAMANALILFAQNVGAERIAFQDHESGIAKR